MLSSPHSFHIPVMGLGYTVDTPIKVARYGISSVVSIMDDQLLERMREIYSNKNQLDFIPISEKEADYRAKRIQAYLDLMHELIQVQMQEIDVFSQNGLAQLKTYVDLLPENHPLQELFLEFFEANSAQEKEKIGAQIQSMIQPGSVDVNIMTKVDKLNSDENGELLPREFSDALSALRGFAQSKLSGSVIFSAGMNPALFAYLEEFSDFFPAEKENLKKQVILKVSDYRSALIQGKFLAKKGIWVSEFRIESGLNCGGHAFATDGFLIGPILEEFKANRAELTQTLFEICSEAHLQKGISTFSSPPQLKVTYQGGIGTAEENSFLQKHYQLDGTGWGSPFLLVPEATSVDDDTLQRIIKAKQADFYLSHASPLGVPFNNLRNSSAEEQRKDRIARNRPGSPCYKKFLSFNTDHTEKPICTASRQYQNIQSERFEKGEISNQELQETLVKDCLCEGLSAPAILASGEIPKRNLSAVTICPGPNLAYFKGIYSLKEMVGHIYGKIKLNLEPERPHVIIKEAQLYVSYLKNEFEKVSDAANKRQITYLEKFRSNLTHGVEYYQNLIREVQVDTEEKLASMKEELHKLYQEIQQLELKEVLV
ncbi:hypothetical protein [Algoriphagus hitonicola]|uniref:Uncharacterized protein n=1 Tax=Algoriphagus hitonicola TaxID=435880 RepID=A0A1I2VS18_9BACT|nr:hypothetical protein [Algoriphagus hitonicola]SFG90276.1 hypothetical protein SAMN04487988_11026 [Algoriphagus hitonicola]